MPRTDAEVLRLCRRAEKLARPLLGIGSEWQINWTVRRDDDRPGSWGHCDLQAEYRRAWIALWPEREPRRLVDTVVHELAHVAQWPFRLYADHVEQFVPEPHQGTDRQAWRHAAEQHITAVLMQSTPIKAVIRQLEQEFGRR